MTMLEIQEEVIVDNDGLDITLSQEIAGLLEETGLNLELADDQTRFWSYRVPFPGVRYYGYEEPPWQRQSKLF